MRTKDNSMGKIKVIIADDHQLFREGLKNLLSKESDVVVIAEAANGRQAVELTEQYEPDIVIMDLSMPILNGIEASKQILARVEDVRVIILSMNSDEFMVLETLKTGVSGYLLKDAAYEELIKAIRAVHMGKSYLSSDITSIVMSDFMRGGKEKASDDPFSILSPREREVLQLIAEGNTTKQISSILNVSIKTVDTHRQTIMKKLDVHSAVELTKYAIKMGIVSIK